MIEELKKIVSAVTAISLGITLLSTVPKVAFAEGETPTPTVEATAGPTVTPAVTAAPTAAPAINPTRTLSVDFLGKDAAPKDTDQGKAKLSSGDVGNTFWVGVAVDKVNDLALFKNGVYSVELTLEYDTKYIVPDNWSSKLAANNMQAGAQKDSTTVWDDNNYRIQFSDNLDVDYQSDRENQDKGQERYNSGRWKMCTILITYKDDATGDKRFTDITSDADHYLVRLPFTLKTMPTDAELLTHPVVLSLVRGPELLDIGSGLDGFDPYASWELATNTDQDGNIDETNLKNLFRYPNDIDLFGNSAEMTDIIVSRKGAEEGESPYTLYKKYEDNTLKEEGFESTTLEYYVSVPNETDKIIITMNASEQPSSVNANDVDIGISDGAASGEYVTQDTGISLNTIDKTVEANGFNNTVKIKLDETTTYILHIRRTLEVEIDLNPGNSPYGLMERMSTKYGHSESGAWDDEKIATAKEKFEQSHTMNKTYHPDYEPEKAQTELDYTKIAWQVKSGSSFVDGTNYDEDPKALFVYEACKFKDPGLTVRGQDGEIINDLTITKELKLKRLLTSGVPTYEENEGVDVDISETDVGGVKKYDLSGKIYRPDVYELVYTVSYPDINDGGTIKTQKIKRPIIVLSRRGDIQLTPSVLHNSNDATNLKNVWSKLKNRSMLFAFRSADLQITPSPLLNSNDATTLKNNWSKMKTAQQYYDISVLE